MARGAGSITFLDEGLGSGTNFQDMIDKLYKVESRQINQLARWRADWRTRVDAFKQVRTELTNLRTTLGKINTVDKFLTKSVSSSNSAVATATAGSEAPEGVYRIKVNQMATTATWSRDTGLANKDAKINSSGSMGNIVYSYKGKQYTVNIPDGTSLEMMKNLINNDSQNPGVKASLIQSGGSVVFQLHGMDMGRDAVLTIDSTTNLTGLGVSNYSRWLTGIPNTSAVYLENSFTALDDKVNTSGSAQNLEINVNGTLSTISVPNNATVNDLEQLLTAVPGLTVQKGVSGGKVFFKVLATNGTDPVSIGAGTTLAGFEPAKWKNPISAIGNDIPFSGTGDVVNSTGMEQTFVFSVDGKETRIAVPDGATVGDLASLVNQQALSSGVVADLLPVGSDFMFRLRTTDASKNLEVGYGTLPEFSKIATPGWTVQHARNSEIRLNGFPADTWIELATNTVSDVVEGLTFNLQSEGDTVISVGIDKEGIVKNVEAFVDAVNSFRKVITELTKYDENKKTVDLKYAESQFEMQKGSVLTGNYGVQLLSSQLKQAVAGSAPGFSSLIKDAGGNVIGGDLFTALSQIGIMTNAEQGNPMYGLLEINTVAGYKGSLAFADALATAPYEVAELFAAKEHGVADSEFFGYASHVHTMTKPGSYDVSYTVDGTGKVTSATINGKQAKIIEENGKIQIGLSSSDNPPNVADGLYLDVYDLTPGATRTGTVGIRSGKVNELIAMMDGEYGMLGKKGALSLLENNYEDIITNIEDKIKKEDDRLQRWENMMILKFSRLETTLGTYKKLQAQLESQLKQLSSNSSS